MAGDYREFLRCLAREPGRPTLFEPYPTRAIATQLLWRGGDHMWSTPAARTRTLIGLHDYMKADTVIVTAGATDIADVLACADALPEGLRFTVLSEDDTALAAADACDAVCALASVRRLHARVYKKPLIRMAMSEADICDAIEDGCAGVHIPTGIEEAFDAYGGKIALLGGLGSDCISNGQPVDIHRRIRALHEKTRGAGWAVGSGNYDGEIAYLGFISMLGIYSNLL
jgi:hypothetical protein